VAKRIELDNTKLKYLREQYPKLGLTLEEIAKHLNVSVETVRRRAKEQNLERPKFMINGDKLEWLKENYNRPYTELTSYLKVNDETIELL
jgi:transcriptional regulator with XRE-family HTH domain